MESIESELSEPGSLRGGDIYNFFQGATIGTLTIINNPNPKKKGTDSAGQESTGEADAGSEEEFFRRHQGTAYIQNNFHAPVGQVANYD